jgi:peroxiredoxin
VMGAWARFSGGEGKLLYLADGNGCFVKAAGLDADMSQANMGTRSRRFSLIAEDGVVKAVNVESKPGVNETGAATILEQL